MLGLRKSLLWSPSVGVVSVLILSLIAGTFPTAAQGARTPQTAVSVPNARLVGRTNAAEAVTLAVSVQPRDPAAIDAFIAALSDPQSPDYGRYLTPQQYTDRFFDAADRAQVVRYLSDQGLTVADSGVGSLFTANGSVAQVEQAFNVMFTDYQDTTSGRVFRAANRTPAIPLTIAPKIAGITGFDNRAIAQPRVVEVPDSPLGASPAVKPRSASGCSDATTYAATNGSFTPNEFADAYGITPLLNAGFRGAGQSVALFELDDYVDSNVATYQTCFGTAVPLTRKPVNGGVAGVQSYGGEGEVELDIEVITGLAPQLAHLYVYEAANTFANALAEYQAIANDHLAPVISSSWGSCEADNTAATRASENLIFQQFATQGQSFFNAIGDDGSRGCWRSDSSQALVADETGSNPYVTGVGGTTLALNATTNAITSEVVWNNSTDGHNGTGVGGGGISQFYARPTYQNGPGTTNSFSNGKRQSPDITADADPYTGYTIYSVGSTGILRWRRFGGTSAGAPLYAAAFAVMNGKLAAQGKPAIGFANPALYTLWRIDPVFIRDTTVGDICVRSGGTAPCELTTPVSYPTTTGYDMASGIGSLNIAAFLNVYLTISQTVPNATPAPAPPHSTVGVPAGVPATHVALPPAHAGTPTPNPQPPRH